MWVQNVHYFQQSHFRSSTKLTDAVRIVACFTHNVSVLSFFSLRNVGNARFVPHGKTKLFSRKCVQSVSDNVMPVTDSAQQNVPLLAGRTHCSQPADSRYRYGGYPSQTSFFWPLLNKSTLSKKNVSTRSVHLARRCCSDWPSTIVQILHHETRIVNPSVPHTHTHFLRVQLTRFCDGSTTRPSVCFKNTTFEGETQTRKLFPTKSSLSSTCFRRQF